MQIILFSLPKPKMIRVRNMIRTVPFSNHISRNNICFALHFELSYKSTKRIFNTQFIVVDIRIHR